MLPQMVITQSKKNQNHKIDSEVPGAWAQGGGAKFQNFTIFLEKSVCHPRYVMHSLILYVISESADFFENVLLLRVGEYDVDFAAHSH